MHWHATFLFTVLLLLIVPFKALALMPPHLTGSTPGDGQTLTTDTMVLHGYTLYEPGQEEIVITDTTTGVSLAWELVKLECESEGDMSKADMPGAIQQRCDLTIKFTGLESGHAYELTFLETVIHFEYQP